MLVTQGRVSDMIRLGGDSGIGFVPVHFCEDVLPTSAKHHLAKEISAMANAKGGWLVLGVDDKSRKIWGIPLERLKTLERIVGEICVDSLKPPLRIDMFRQELPDESGMQVQLLLIRIEKSLYIHQAPGGYFRRTGSSARPWSNF